MNRIIVTATAALGFMASLPASAEVSWSFSSSSCSNGVGNNLYGSCSSTGNPTSAPDVTARAYSNTGGNSWTGGSSTNPTYSSAQTIEAAYVGVYSANPGELGVTNYDATSRNGQTVDTSEGSNPEHSLDNNQRYDSLLFSFTSAIQLTSVQMGWWSGDSDITLLAYTGTLNADGSIPSNKLVGLTYSSLLSNGWVLAGNYANVQSNKTAVNSGGLSAQHWLVGAFNPLGGSVPNGFSQGDDNVKVKYLFGEYSTSSSSSSSSSGGTVPEPGSLLLVSLSIAAVAGLRKRRKA
ncbi:MAG: exosortase-dependent surface protein XDP1 [Moraxellaceae bacterium]|nr:exosortase-dependent surface protein XDP1 [Moraxellaceae bacterium]